MMKMKKSGIVFNNVETMVLGNIGNWFSRTLKKDVCLMVLNDITTNIMDAAAMTKMASPAKMTICDTSGFGGVACLKMARIPAMMELKNLLAIQIIARPSTTSKLVTVLIDVTESIICLISKVLEKIELEFKIEVIISGEACRKRSKITRIIMTTGMNEKRNPKAHADA